MPSGIMVALYLPEEIQQQLALPGGEAKDSLHVTLCYVKGIGEDDDAVKKMVKALAPVCADFAPVSGRIGGYGVFNASENSDGKDVYYASYNSSVLPVLQQEVVKAIEAAGFEISRDHGYTPHVTLKYLGTNETLPAKVRHQTENFTVANINVVSKRKNEPVALTGKRVLKSDPGGSAVHVDVPIGGDVTKPKKKKPKRDASTEVIPPPVDNLGANVMKDVPKPTPGIDPATADDADAIFTDKETKDLSSHAILAMEALGFQHVSKELVMVGDSVMVPIAKADPKKKIVYGAVLVPDEIDSQGDLIKAEDIELAAHHYMENARKVRKHHENDVKATPVESYITPVDMVFETPYGTQKIAKGSWILAVKVHDDKEWEKIEKGEYQAFSVGGTGSREAL